VTDETDLRLYPARHDLRGLSAAQLADARRAPGAAVRRVIRRGSHIRYVPRIWAPVERRCPSAPQLASVHRALGEAVRRVIRRGSHIRYVPRIYAPGEQRCLCLFEAPGPEVVRAVNDIAQFPLAHVVAVLSSVPAT
jgi:hypothetical protein